MDQLAEEMPLFGGDPRESLNQAQGEMGSAHRELRQARLPGASHHEGKAVEHLEQLRQAFEKAFPHPPRQSVAGADPHVVALDLHRNHEVVGQREIGGNRCPFFVANTDVRGPGCGVLGVAAI